MPNTPTPAEPIRCPWCGHMLVSGATPDYGSDCGRERAPRYDGRLKVAKSYAMPGGNRFVALVTPDGARVDVRVRTGRDGVSLSTVEAKDEARWLLGAKLAGRAA